MFYYLEKANVIKFPNLLSLKWGEYPELSGWAQWHRKRAAYKWEREAEEDQDAAV